MLRGTAVPAQVAPAVASASPVAVAAAAGQVIAGRVVSAADGHPLANAMVTLGVQPQQRRGRQGAPDGATTTAQGGRNRDAPGSGSQTAQTDAEGRYRFPPQPAGRYSLYGSAPGYIPSLYLEHEGFSSAVVTGAGVPSEDLHFVLLPEASLHGRVLDETGEPVRANVTLYRDSSEDTTMPAAGDGETQRFRPAGTVQADDDGRYEFTTLRAGRYYVAATGTPWYAVHPRPQMNEERLPYRTAVDPGLDVAYPVTFFPHATTEQGALPITLKPGGRATANLLMQAEHAVTLTVQLPATDPSPGSGGSPFPSLSRKVFGGNQPTGFQNITRVGQTVVLSGLAPGQYSVRSFGRGAPQNSNEAEVNLSTGSATMNMPAPPAGGGDAVVSVRDAGGTAMTDVDAELVRVRPGRGGVPVSGRMEQGSLRFSGLDAGDYRLQLRGRGTNWNVSRLSVNGKAVSSKLLRVDGGTVQAEVVASSYSPEVEGVVHGADGKVHAGSLVVLVPAGTDPGEDLFRADQSDLDGGFQFMNVLPGNYLLVAIDHDWALHWHDAAALMRYLPHALPVSVGASGPRVVALGEAAVVQQK